MNVAIDHGMSEAHGERTADWLLCVARELELVSGPDARLLELGCGNGVLVDALRKRGIQAFGCDLQFKQGPKTELLRESGWLASIETSPYRLPFDDDSFDLVVSVSVLEHVMNLDETIAETARITRPGGAGFHIFPSRYRPVEPHTFVPLGTVLRTPWWLRLWAAAGVRNSYQRELSARDAARINYDYLHQSTNYLTRGAIRRGFEASFASVRFCEDVLVSCAAGTRSHRLGLGRAMRRSKLLTLLYSGLRERAVCVRKA